MKYYLEFAAEIIMIVMSHLALEVMCLMVWDFNHLGGVILSAGCILSLVLNIRCSILDNLYCDYEEDELE